MSDQSEVPIKRRGFLAAIGAATSAGCTGIATMANPSATKDNTQLVVRGHGGVVESVSLKSLQGQLCDTSATHRVIVAVSRDAEPRSAGVVARNGSESYTQQITPGERWIPFTVYSLKWYDVVLVGPDGSNIGRTSFRIEYPDAGCNS